MNLFRCYSCTNDKGLPGKEFSAENSVCPNCGADGDDPRDATLVVPLVRVHLDPPSGRPHRGRGHLACNPEIKVGDGTRATGHPEAVTCPECLATQEFADLKAAFKFDPTYDVPISVTAAGPRPR